jgi:hypothetical protein
MSYKQILFNFSIDICCLVNPHKYTGAGAGTDKVFCHFSKDICCLFNPAPELGS